MRFTAQTGQAQAAMAKLTQQMQAVSAAQAAVNAAQARVNRGLAGGIPNMHFNLKGELSQLDQLTQKVQKGKINQREYQDIIRGNNKLFQYQNALQQASLTNLRAMGNGSWSAGMNVPLQQHRSLLKATAADWATLSAASRAYGRNVMDIGKNMAFMGRQAMLSVTAPIALIAGATAAAFYQVDKQVTNLAKVYGDAGGNMRHSIGTIREAARGLSSEMNRMYGTSIKDTLELATAFAALGESGKDLDYMVGAAARLMRLGDVTTESATKMISTLRTVFKYEGQALEDAINMANTFENSTTLTMQDFSDALPKMGSIVQSWGGDMRQAGILIENFTRNGINAVEGANALKATFASLVKPTKQLEGAFSAMLPGYQNSLGDISKAAGGDVNKILAEIGRLQEEFGVEESVKKSFVVQLAGKYQLNRVMGLIEAAANPTEEIAKIMAMSEKELADYNKQVADREVAIQMQSASAQFKQTINQLQMIAERAGEWVLPKITAALKFMINMGGEIKNVFSAIADALGPLAPIVGKIGLAAAGAAAAFGPLMLLLSSTFLIRGGLITAMGVVAGLMSKIMNPKGNKGPIFVSGAQRAAQLQAQQMQSTMSGQQSATTALTSAINRLNAAYAQMQAAQARASAAANRTTAAQTTQAARMTSATNSQTNAINNQSRAQQRANNVGAAAVTPNSQRNAMGGMVLNNANRLGSAENKQAAKDKAQQRRADTAARASQIRAQTLTPQPMPAPVTDKNGIARQARLDAQLYNRIYSAERRRQEARGSAVMPAANPMRGKSEAERRAAAGFGLGSGTVSTAGGTSNAAFMARNQTDAQGRVASKARAEELAHQENTKRNATAINQRYQDASNKIGGMAVGLGLVGSLLGGTNKLVQSLGIAFMVAGTILMTFPALLGKIGVFIEAMRARMAAFTAQSAIATRVVGGLGMAMKLAFTPLMIVAAAGAAAYGVFRLLTSESRKLAEQNEAIKNSTEGWANVLGYARTQFGQLKNEAGEVVDTMKSLEKEALNDENLKPLIERLKTQATDVAALRSSLEQEAVKLFADGANEAQVKQALEVLMNAANVDPTIKADLNLEFESIKPTGLNGTGLSESISSSLNSVFGTALDNTVSGWQQMWSEKNPFTHMFSSEGDFQQDAALSQKARQQLDAIFNQMNNEVANASDTWSKGSVLRGYFDNIKAQIDSGMAALSPELNRAVEEAGGIGQVNVGEMIDQFELDDDAARSLQYYQNVFNDLSSRIGEVAGNEGKAHIAMLNDIGSAQVLMAAKTGSAMNTYEQAMDQFREKQRQMGEAWNELTPEEQASMLNFYRMSVAGLGELGTEAAATALSQGNLGKRVEEGGAAAKGATPIVEDLADAAADLNKEWEDKTATWTAKVNMEDGSTLAMTPEEAAGMHKSVMENTWGDVMDEYAAQAQIQFDAQKRAFADSQKSVADAMQASQAAESKAMDKAQEAEKEAFANGWEERLKNEKKGFEDRIKAIEDTQEAEDELERQRKRNADREERRQKYMQSLMQSGIDINIALAGGDLDEVARLSLNAQTTSQDYATANTEAEAGYAKEDADKARSSAIDMIKEEEAARMESLEKQKAAEEKAMNDRLEIQREELTARQAAQTAYLQRKQEDENIAYEISFQANQRSLNRELEALRTQIPLNEAELASHMGRLNVAYDDHGVSLMGKGDFWAETIENSLINRTREATRQMSNDKMWEEYGQRVAEGAAMGAFNMSAADFNKFLRTGELPASGPAGGGGGGGSTAGVPNAGRNSNAVTRHAGGPIGTGNDGKYNNRKGLTNRGLHSSEVMLRAQKGEYVMQRSAVQNYGSGFMSAVNSGNLKSVNPSSLPKDPNVKNPNAVGGFGEMGAAMAAITMGSIIGRTVEAAGSAMMSATSGGGGAGDIGAINISQKAGRYGNSTLNETQLKTASLIAEAAKEVGASRRDLTIALMTAFQESSMGTNGMYVPLDHDSLGAFQQRAPWGNFAERTDVKSSAKMFFLGGKGGQPGLFSVKGRDSMSMGRAAQIVQVSGNPSGYDQWQDEAEALVAAGVGTGISRSEVKENAKGIRYGGWTTEGIKKFAQNAQEKFGSSVGSDGTPIGPGGPMNVQPGEYQNPVPGSPVTSGFGMRWGAMHDGVDFGAPTGTHIYATKAGTVTFASNYDDGGFGLHTVIDHGGGITSGYAHQSRLGASVGQQVAKGQHIGYVGNTGNSTGPHLHFQLGRGSSGGKYSYTTNPANFIPGLQVGGNIKYDNTIANLHKGETVLTSPLSEQLKLGIEQFANQGIVGYDDIVGKLQNDSGRLISQASALARNAYNSLTPEQQNVINVELRNANITGVDELERRLREWADQIVARVAQENIQKMRRTGAMNK